MDPRNEPQCWSQRRWTELKAVRETNFEIEQILFSHLSELPGSEKDRVVMTTARRDVESSYKFKNDA